MKGSLKLVRFAGIDVYVHWTFAILIVWLLISDFFAGSELAAMAMKIVFVLSIFACVVLHEFGHALTARRYGIRTRDITLLPIGGVARLERMPDEPKQELIVAIAGPAVNVVIAGILAGVIYLLHGEAAFANLDINSAGFLAQLMIVNIILVLFNLIPAFPMDGGRVLRALLAMRMDYVRATQIAANTGQIFAIGFGLLGVFYNPLLIFIALFVYIGAQQEARLSQVRTLLSGVPVSAAMVKQFRSVEPQTRLSDVVEQLLTGEQRDFPVVESGQLVGLLTRGKIVDAVSQGMQDQNVASVMNGKCGTVDPREMLQETFFRMQQSECSTLPVARDGQVLGIITLENIGEWMMIQSAVRQALDNK